MTGHLTFAAFMAFLSTSSALSSTAVSSTSALGYFTPPRDLVRCPAGLVNSVPPAPEGLSIARVVLWVLAGSMDSWVGLNSAAASCSLLHGAISARSAGEMVDDGGEEVTQVVEEAIM